MSRFGFLFAHFIPSLLNWPRLFCRHPVFALKLLWQRAFFFAMRRVPHALIDSDGFVIDTPEVLNSYWSMFAERALLSKEWTESFQQANEPLVLDIGANAGAFIHLVRGIRPDVKIHAFEPLPAMAARLRNWAKSFENFTLHEGACSSSSGTATFYIRSENDTTATLETENASVRQKLEVQTFTVDELIPEQEIFMMKIDVEGHEPDVLKGAHKRLTTTHFLIIEAHTKEQYRNLANILGADWISRKLDPINWLFMNRKYATQRD